MTEAEQAAFRRGAEAMREVAADVLKKERQRLGAIGLGAHAMMFDSIEVAIRALPLPDQDEYGTARRRRKP